MFGNGVTRSLFFISVISIVHNGNSLECYVCTSLEDSACTSSLSGLTPTTCSSSGASGLTTTIVTENSSTASITAETTTSSDTETTVTTDATSGSSTDTTLANSTLKPTTLVTKTEDSVSTISETTTRSSISTTVSTSLDTNTTVESTSSASNESTLTGTTATLSATLLTVDGNASGLLESGKGVQVVRVLRDTEESFACYTLTVVVNETEVIDRGCVAKDSTACDILQEANYPSLSLSSCETCTEDGCNSSGNNLSGISSAFVLLIMLVFTR
ncbi:serine-rich adhesin for platelets [Diprion similis]|uniref:serine-rich adhesin for platelets n=1 Tax=Diprion similis TaxID=362088 RepID=UPI001EF86C41|nr:serine-rich adhesin for platelets [Diprion similis]